MIKEVYIYIYSIPGRRTFEIKTISATMLVEHDSTEDEKWKYPSLDQSFSGNPKPHDFFVSRESHSQSLRGSVILS